MGNDVGGGVGDAEMDASEMDTPEMDTSEMDAPGMDASEVDAPEVDAPGMDASETNAWEMDAPEMDHMAGESGAGQGLEGLEAQEEVVRMEPETQSRNRFPFLVWFPLIAIAVLVLGAAVTLGMLIAG